MNIICRKTLFSEICNVELPFLGERVPGTNSLGFLKYLLFNFINAFVANMKRTDEIKYFWFWNFIEKFIFTNDFKAIMDNY